MGNDEPGAGSRKSGVTFRLGLGRRIVAMATLALTALAPASLALTAWGGAADRNSASLDEMVRGIESRYRAVRTLRLAFTQTYQWGGRSRVESGTAYFARGGLMRWDYREPQSKLVVSDGKRLWLYIPEEKQVTLSSMKTNE